MRQSTKTRIKSVAGLLLSAILCAALFATYMIYQYGPTGRYVAGNVILSPSVMEQINYSDEHHAKGKRANFVFNSIEFAYFDKILGQTKKINVAPNVYEHFYNLVATQKDLDLSSISVQNQRLFLTGFPANLTMTLKADSSSSAQTKVFQIIQFVETDYFRVQLHGEKDAGDWAYFYVPNIYKDIVRLFTNDV